MRLINYETSIGRKYSLLIKTDVALKSAAGICKQEMVIADDYLSFLDLLFGLEKEALFEILTLMGVAKIPVTEDLPPELAESSGVIATQACLCLHRPLIELVELALGILGEQGCVIAHLDEPLQAEVIPPPDR